MEINAVFEGGGVRGIALAGAILAAEQEGITFHRVAGTSSGAIVASLVASGYTAEEMKDIILTMPFSSFLKRASIFNIKWIGPAMRLLLRKGLYSGDALEYWIDELLRKKGVRTFGDIGKDRLRIIASDITNGRIVVLPDDLHQYGIQSKHFPISKAVRMSTSIPYFFDPVMMREQLKSGRKKPFRKSFTYIVDGGLLSNFPLWLFEDETDPRTKRMVPTIGFQLVGKNEGQPHSIHGLISMLQAMVETMLSAHDERYIEQRNRFRTIKIPTLGVGVTQFDVSEEMSLELYQSGEAAGQAFFDQWTYTQYEHMFKQYTTKPNIHVQFSKKGEDH